MWAAHERGIKASKKSEDHAKRAKAAEDNSAISSNNPDAIELLEAKLSKLEEKQAQMKAANTYYRKHKTMKGYQSLTDEQAEKMDNAIKYGINLQQLPYPVFTQQNNNTTIRATKRRIAQLKMLDRMPTEDIPFDNGKIIINTDENRIQIFFDERPDSDMIVKLKRHGFKWSPKNQRWQRLRNTQSLRAAKDVCGISQI